MLATSQVLQVGLVAIVAGLIFFVLGLILLSPELLAQWSRNGSSDGQILGMTLPVPQSLIQISMFLAAMTFMYVSARAVGDNDYRIPLPGPAHRRPAPDAGCAQPLPGGRRDRNPLLAISQRDLVRLTCLQINDELAVRFSWVKTARENMLVISRMVIAMVIAVAACFRAAAPLTRDWTTS